MPPARPVATVRVLAAMMLIGLSVPAWADGEAAMRHAIWRDCLARNFHIQSALTAPSLAADAAFRACRAPEDAYLAALSDSPLLDSEDVTQARPLLAGRIRAWLIGRAG